MEAKVKKLENEVIRLRDELARMKRFYEDLLYNLDDDNFSSKFLKEKNGMKTAISVTEEGIKTLVQKDTELDGKIKSVSSSISQTATNVAVSVIDTQFESYYNQYADGITLKVNSLIGEEESVFTQTADGFFLDGEKTSFSGVIYLTDKEYNNKFSVFYDNSQNYEQIFLHSVATDESGYGYAMPIVIGNGKIPKGLSTDIDVFVGSVSTDNQVATRGWVQANPQPAVFG